MYICMYVCSDIFFFLLFSCSSVQALVLGLGKRVNRIESILVPIPFMDGVGPGQLERSVAMMLGEEFGLGRVERY